MKDGKLRIQAAIGKRPKVRYHVTDISIINLSPELLWCVSSSLIIDIAFITGGALLAAVSRHRIF